MKNKFWLRGGRLLVLTSVAFLSTAVMAEEGEAPPTGWFDTAEVSFFATSGNAESQTLALRNTLTRLWEGASLSFAAGAVRAESTTTERFALGSPSGFSLTESSESALTAENYFLRSRYDRVVNERLFWFGGLGWDKNEFAGIDSRTAAIAGVGHTWRDDESSHFRTTYGLTFTDQDDVSGASSSFAGVQLSYDYGRQLNANTAFASLLLLDGNADETSDYRADFVNSVRVAMSERLALKASLQLLYDNLPALGSVPIIDDIGGLTGGTVLVPLDDLDSILTVSLVADF